MQEQEPATPPPRPPLTPERREHLRAIGRKGGAKGGDTKRRGDAAYYQAIARARWAKAQNATP